jgi:hypothetical protein
MKAGGVLLVIAGIWVLCQVLGGDALTRLGVTTDGSDPADNGPKVDGQLIVPPGTKDPQGRPY